MSGMDQLKEKLQPLIEEQLERYRALPQREQNMVMILALFLALTLPIFGVVLPLEDQRKAMVEDVRMLEVQAKEAEHLADQLQSGVAKPAAGGNVMSEVDRIARSSGVREFMTRIKPQASVGGGSSLMLQMKNAPYAKVVSFMTAISEKGLGISQIKLQRADSSGYVHLQAVVVGS